MIQNSRLINEMHNVVFRKTAKIIIVGLGGERIRRRTRWRPAFHTNVLTPLISSYHSK